MDFPLRLERYFFPVQQVEANPKYDPQAVQKHGTTMDFKISPLIGRADAYGAELNLSSDPASENPSYTFNLTAFAVLRVEESTPEPQRSTMAGQIGVQMLVGVARERLAELTARGPWPTVMLDVVPLVPAGADTSQSDKSINKDSPE